METGEKVLKLISKGNLDGYLDAIVSTSSTRMKYLRAVEAYEQVQRIKPGDRIKIKHAVRPRYLVGKTGTVVQISGKTRAGVPMVEVKLDSPIGKYRNGMILLHGSSFMVTGYPLPGVEVNS